MTSILLVDRSPTAGAGLVNALRKRRGLDVIAADENEVRESLQWGIPNVVLVDVHHGDGDGALLCAKIRRFTDAPIVILASFMTAERWNKLKGAGASEFLLKHVDTAALERDLVRIAATHQPDSQPALGGANSG